MHFVKKRPQAKISFLQNAARNVGKTGKITSDMTANGMACEITPMDRP